MAIHKPGRVLLHHIPLKFVRKKVSGGGRKASDHEIPLVPFIDFLITLDGRRMADTRTLSADARVERQEQLIQDLETLKRNWSILHPSGPFAGTVILQADINIDFRVIKKIMFSCAQAGYANVSFAVNRVGGE